MWGKASSCNTLNSEAEGNAEKCDTSRVDGAESKFKKIYINIYSMLFSSKTEKNPANDNAKGQEKWVKRILRENKCHQEEPQTEPIDTGSFFSVAA